MTDRCWLAEIDEDLSLPDEEAGKPWKQARWKLENAILGKH